jgi:hypothetical protein
VTPEAGQVCQHLAMRRIVGTGVCGLLVAVLAAGCSAGAPAAYRPTFDTCYAFDLQAIQRQITVTGEPQACAGLSREQVNQAVASAVRKAVGSEPKAVARRLAARDGAYLAHIVSTVQPAPAVPPAAVSARTSPGLPLSVAALAAWLVTAAAGAYLLAGWLAADGDFRRRLRRLRPTGVVAVTVFSHFGLALAGLVIWIAFMVTGVPVLAWLAVGVIIGVAGLGMGALSAALPDPARGTALRARLPVTVIALHGMFATATILLVLLAAIGAG